MENCLFCRIINGEVPSVKVYEDDLVLAYLDINPVSKGHTLVIPKAHSEGLLDTPDETLAAVVARTKKIAAYIKEVLGCGGFNIVQNNGETAGQTVRHVHFHIVPRYEGDDPLVFKGAPADMTALAELAKALKV